MSIYFDLFDNGNQKANKYERETNEDNNFMVNKSTVMNLHFFMGAFVCYIDQCPTDKDNKIVPSSEVE